VSHGHIEHVVPKSTSPHLAFEWANLTLACDVCNTNKGAHEGLTDPYNSEPEEEFTFRGPMMFHREGGLTAEYTKTQLQLNRSDLMERRAERLDGINDKICRIRASAGAPEEKQRLIDTVIRFETEDDREYAACCRRFLE
jgi:hypothetical protein